MKTNELKIIYKLVKEGKVTEEDFLEMFKEELTVSPGPIYVPCIWQAPVYYTYDWKIVNTCGPSIVTTTNSKTYSSTISNKKDEFHD